jgi:hypothetical protein
MHTTQVLRLPAVKPVLLLPGSLPAVWPALLLLLLSLVRELVLGLLLLGLL